MNIIKPSHEIMIPTSPYKHIERVGRICYRSEDLITETSAESFVRRLFNSGHHAMLEHFRFIIEVKNTKYNLAAGLGKYGKYITFTDDGRYVISASARGLNDTYKHNGYLREFIACAVQSIVNEYKCPDLFDSDIINTQTSVFSGYCKVIKNFDELSSVEYMAHAWYSIHFVCDRGVTHEMVRHRDASFAQESTRYCNYSKGKYGSEITVIEPLFWDENSDQYYTWWYMCHNAELAYKKLIDSGAKPQEARSILPNSLKTEIVITAQMYEWIHIFNLRVLGTTGAPHPQIKEVMKPAYDEMVKKGYINV